MMILIAQQITAQKYFTRSGYVRFFSAAPLENIEATNNQATCIVDIETGEVISKIIMKAFQFEKALMQEHFNENYVESNTYPQAVLNAKIKNIEELDFSSKQKQMVVLEGSLTIKDVSQNMIITGEFYKKGNTLVATAQFMVKPADHNITIPRAVRDNIAQEIEVNLSFNLEEFNR